MAKKKEAQVIKFSQSKIVVQFECESNELSVMKLALKCYNNGYGLNLLRRIERAEAKTINP